MSHPQPTLSAVQDHDEEWQPHAAEEFQQVGTIGKIAIGLLGASTLTHLLSTWSDWNTYGVVNQFLRGGLDVDVDAADLNRADAIAKITAVPNVVISVAAAVVFVIWLWRARVNSEVFCQADHRRSHGWVLASWFCPGPNLWYPKQIVDDVWLASDPKTPVYTDDLRRFRTPALTTVWWVTWIGALAFDVVVRRFLMWMEATVGSLRGIALAGTASLLLTAVSAVAATLVIRKINHMQTSREWVPWWDQREPKLTAVPTYANDDTDEQPAINEPIAAAPALRLERQPELQLAGGGPAPAASPFAPAPAAAPAPGFPGDGAAAGAFPGGGSPFGAPAAFGGDRPFGGDDRSFGNDRPFGDDRSLGGDRAFGDDRSLGGDRPFGGDRAFGGERPAFGEVPPAFGGDAPVEEAPKWSPFAPVVQSWQDDDSGPSTEQFDAVASWQDEKPAAWQDEKPATEEPAYEKTTWSDYLSSANDDPLSTTTVTASSYLDETPPLTVVEPEPYSYQPSQYQQSEYQQSEYQQSAYQPSGYEPSGYQPAASQPAVSQPAVSQPAAEAPSWTGSYSESYSSEGYSSGSYSSETSDYLTSPSAPAEVEPAPEPEPAPVARAGRRAARVAVDSPSAIQPESSSHEVYAPSEHTQPSSHVSAGSGYYEPAPAVAQQDDFLTPSKPLPPVPSYGPEPSYPESSYPAEPTYSSYVDSSYQSTYDAGPEYTSYGQSDYSSSSNYEAGSTDYGYSSSSDYSGSYEPQTSYDSYSSTSYSGSEYSGVQPSYDSYSQEYSADSYGGSSSAASSSDYGYYSPEEQQQPEYQQQSPYSYEQQTPEQDEQTSTTPRTHPRRRWV
ncbi:DUF4328 domain-containing protein [Kribbella sp. CA-247076]|uniref:DUF4328 domain-containing protein n=1 Tax=Kribbella sp. CA-247076 TaxID=3239941 RepID=UPI003D8AD35E